MKPVNADLSRREMLVGSLGVAAALSFGDLSKMTTPDRPSQPSDNHQLWYRQPAAEWTEALPIGNGFLGAMLFGGTQTERIQLNETTIWAGEPHCYDNPEALGVLPEIRSLIFAGKIKEAQQIADRHFMSKPLGQMPYQTAGSLILEFPRSDSEIADYKRNLNLEDGVHEVSFRQDGVLQTRQAFADFHHKVIVVKISGAGSFRARLECPLHGSAICSGDELVFTGQGGDADGLHGKIRFVTRVRAHAEGGTVRADGSDLVVENAKTVWLTIAIATNYKSYEDLTGDPEKETKSQLDQLRGHELKPAQLPYGKFDLHIAGKTTDLPTDERILAFQEGRDDTLPILYFNYGRYLLVSCSRPGGKPANLQGLWNDSVSPPWGSKYTININTEMNYWPAETCALSDCVEPLFDMLRDMSVTGAKTAKTHYGARGWVAHHNTDIWRGTAPIDGAAWGIWQTGGAWLCTNIWQHYLFTLDEKKLRKNYPLMKGAAEFFVDTLVPHPAKGWLVTCPSASPENSHHPGEGLCAGPTMDMQIIRDLFEGCIEASKVLKVDESFRNELIAMQAKLAPMQIGSHGQLQEWLDDWDEFAPEQHHRHVSHLYGLFPSLQIDRWRTPELFSAAQKSLEIRGDEGTGWSLAWKINLWARLHDGDHALNLIRDALRPVWTRKGGGGGVYQNLFDAHPPFQIDGNFGFTSGVAEMLLQSRPGEITLLPALPAAWADGSCSGLRGRGGLKVALSWRNGKLSEAVVTATKDCEVNVRYGNQVKAEKLVGGVPKRVGT